MKSLTAEGCRARRERLWAALEEKPDWILLSEPRHLVYFANYYVHPFSFRGQTSAALLILGADGSSCLVADNVVQPHVEQSHVDEALVPTWYRCIESAEQRQELLVRTALDAMRKRAGERIGIAAGTFAGMTLALQSERPGTALQDVAPALHRVQRLRDPDEVELVRLSAQAAAAGYAAAAREVRPGMTEVQAFLRVQSAVNEFLGEPAQIYGDFAAGPRAEAGGGDATSRTIQDGELFILDYSVIVHGYRCDLSNTFVVAGDKPTARQKELEQLCLAAMTAGERLLKPGVACREVDRAVRAVFAEQGVEERFGHHSGHGIGLGHPDPPYIVPESDETLEVGDVVTLEPGQYHPGVGGMRFEHNYLITETGYERLSSQDLGLDPPR